MRKCIAYYPGTRHSRPWVPCPRRAAYNSALCRTHADALGGIVYGLGILISSAIVRDPDQSGRARAPHAEFTEASDIASAEQDDCQLHDSPETIDPMTRRRTSFATKASSKSNARSLDAPGLLLAASVDAGGHSAAMAADTSPSAGALRDAYAEVAAAEDRAARLHSPGVAPRLLAGAQFHRGAEFDCCDREVSTDADANVSAASRKSAGPLARCDAKKHDDSDLPEMYPTDVPLPDDPGIFVDEIHEVVDLQQQWVNLLRSEDEKIRQRAIERLTDMKYKGAHSVDEEPRLILDLPRPASIPPEHEN